MDPQLFVVLSQTTICFAALIALIVIWVSIERKSHIRWWIASFGAAFLASFLSVFPVSAYPSEDFFFLVTNLLNIIIAICTPYGFAIRAEIRAHYLWLLIPAVIYSGALIWFSFITPHAGLSTGLPYLLGTASLLTSCYLLMQYGKRNLPEMGTIFSFSFVAVANLAETFIAVSQGQLVQPETIMTLINLNNIVQPAGFVAMAIFINLLIASDLAERMRNLAMTDSMTGLLNRRGLIEAVEKILANMARTKQTASLIICDIDHFKAVNDTFGHDIGDDVIKAFAFVIEGNIRQGDFAGRIGGEEFVVLLPDTQLSDARNIAERIRTTIAPKTYHFGDKEVAFTASFGISTTHDYQFQYEVLLKQADEALYSAKQGGRNQVQLSSY